MILTDEDLLKFKEVVDQYTNHDVPIVYACKKVGMTPGEFRNIRNHLAIEAIKPKETVTQAAE